MGRVTPGYGVDVVVPIAVSTFEGTEPRAIATGPNSQKIVDGQPALGWDDHTRNAIMQALHETLEEPDAVADLEVEPGYIRVRFDVASVTNADGEDAPADLAKQVLGVGSTFDSEREVDRDGGLSLRHRDVYRGLYQPEGSSPEGFIARYGAGEREDADGPILTWGRERDDRRRDPPLRYNVVIPIKPETYEPERKIPAFEWDAWSREQFVGGLESGPHTRTGGLSVHEAAVYRSHICLTVGVAAGMPPHRTALKAARVASSAISRRPMRTGENGESYRQPRLELSRSVWIGAADGSEGGKAFIQGLDDVDPTPEPEPEPESEPEEPEQSTKSGVWKRLSPFGGA